MISLEEFSNYLASGKIDWDFYLSTDPVIYMDGEREQQNLEDIANNISKEALQKLADMRRLKWNLEAKKESK